VISNSVVTTMKKSSWLKRRKLKLKAKLESRFSFYSFKRLVPGAFNGNLIGSACTALPGWCAPSSTALTTA